MWTTILVPWSTLLKRHGCHDLFQWCCQTNAHKSQFCSNLNLLGCAEAAPLGKSGGAVQLEI
jgi:hypothetical protein